MPGCHGPSRRQDTRFTSPPALPLLPLLPIHPALHNTLLLLLRGNRPSRGPPVMLVVSITLVRGCQLWSTTKGLTTTTSTTTTGPCITACFPQVLL